MLPARTVIGLLTVLCLLLPLNVSAGMYVYVDENGNSHFTNAPNSSRYKPMRFNRENIRRERAAISSSGESSPADFEQHIRRAALSHNVDPLLIKAIIKAESDFNSRAVSPKGALGLMQLMPETARDMQVGDPLDAAQNIAGGTRYFSNLLNIYGGNVSLSLAAYNAGPSRVAKNGPLPGIRETRDYVRKVIRFYRSYQQATPVSLSGNINMHKMVTIN